MTRVKNGKICPICGKHKFEYDNDFEICPVCGWEDDAVQRADPDYPVGANGMSLNEYKRRSIEVGNIPADDEEND